MIRTTRQDCVPKPVVTPRNVPRALRHLLCPSASARQIEPAGDARHARRIRLDLNVGEFQSPSHRVPMKRAWPHEARRPR